MLTGDIVVERDARKAWTALRDMRIARGGGVAVSEQVDGNDEMARRIDGPSRPKQRFVPEMRAGEKCRQENGIVSCGVQRPIGYIGKPGVPQHLT